MSFDESVVENDRDEWRILRATTEPEEVDDRPTRQEIEAEEQDW
jgi:hypothetical protein